MSIALHTSGGGCGDTSRFNIDPPLRFISRIPFMAMYGSSDPPIGGKDADSNSSSSSIGKNSDDFSANEVEGADNEAQSERKGPLDTLDILEDVLPVKKGISKFYSGKSKSFTSLADASAVSSINDLAKPENTYGKKRKNKLANTLYLEESGGKTSKHSRSVLYKPQASGIHGTLGSLAAVPGSESSSSSPHGLPPLHPRSSKGSEEASPPSEQEQSIQPSSRSLSLSDLYSATGSADSPPSAGASPSSASSSAGK